MRTSKLHAVLAAVAVVGIACPGPDDITAPVSAWTAVMIGANEVPAVTSSAAGTASFTLSGSASVAFTINITALPATAITASHLHQAAAGTNQNTIAVSLCGTAPAGACNTLTAPGVLATGTVTVSTAQLNAMRAFGMYVNVHTTQYTGGEIRGQLLIVPPAGE